MKKYLFGLFLALTSALSYADLMASSGKDYVQLHETVCSSPEVLKRIDPSIHALLKAGTAEVGGTKYALCWYPFQNHIALMYDDGDQGLVPMTYFTERGT
jgi:hypothetical protein